jgi:ABC-type multidrug transport system fused ATPase/permease subunit
MAKGARNDGEASLATTETDTGRDRFNNRIALTIALLASFIAFLTIKSANVAEAMQQAQAERNNGWAWYQAVRVREDMATYELANLERLARGAAKSGDAQEAALLSAAIKAQNEEIARIRTRLAEVMERAKGAEASYAGLNALGDQYDFAEALIAIAVTLLAVATLAQAHWLYWFALAPGALGVAIGAAAMAHLPLDLAAVLRLVG